MSAADMYGRFFLDTNILIYALDQSAPEKQRIAGQLIRDALGTGMGLISTQVVQEFLHASRRKFKQPMTLAERQHHLRVILSPLCQYFPVISSYEQALLVSEETGYTFYDALIVTAAIESGCRVLYTEDLQHDRVVQNVRVVNPFLAAG